MLPTPVLNTKGAARRLGCSLTWIHKLAARGALKAYTYGDDGELIAYETAPRKSGRALYFLAEDVAQYRPAVQRRPRGSKNKSSRSENHLSRPQGSPKKLILLVHCWRVW
ncbi:MAG: hypothetical protein JO202_20130 [Ktedonobacteraceae bacterium]|nr:hypothetical protein [Ktedonobacteraceae bacterium]